MDGQPSSTYFLYLPNQPKKHVATRWSWGTLLGGLFAIGFSACQEVQPMGGFAMQEVREDPPQAMHSLVDEKQLEIQETILIPEAKWDLWQQALDQLQFCLDTTENALRIIRDALATCNDNWLAYQQENTALAHPEDKGITSLFRQTVPTLIIEIVKLKQIATDLQNVVASFEAIRTISPQPWLKDFIFQMNTFRTLHNEKIAEVEYIQTLLQTASRQTSNPALEQAMENWETQIHALDGGYLFPLSKQKASLQALVRQYTLSATKVGDPPSTRSRRTSSIQFSLLPSRRASASYSRIVPSIQDEDAEAGRSLTGQLGSSTLTFDDPEALISFVRSVSPSLETSGCCASTNYYGNQHHVGGDNAGRNLITEQHTDPQEETTSSCRYYSSLLYNKLYNKWPGCTIASGGVIAGGVTKWLGQSALGTILGYTGSGLCCVAGWVGCVYHLCKQQPSRTHERLQEAPETQEV